MGTVPHFHQVETHGFHLHISQHDNIDISASHHSDTQEISLDVETHYLKIIKVLAIVFLTLFILSIVYRKISIVRIFYFPLFKKPFEVVYAMRRGPPAI